MVCPVCIGGKGGHVAAKRMTAKERSERARKAAKASAIVRKNKPQKQRT